MRITGGEMRGRQLRVPVTDLVRPTQDRVREALFNMLGEFNVDAKWLDLFAGSGAVGIEALSRAASRVTFVEQEARHITTLQRNLTDLQLVPRAEVVRADVYAWLASAAQGRAYDIAFADPPYELGAQHGYADVLALLAEHKVVKTGGFFITEMRAHQHAEPTDAWEVLRDRLYGQTRVVIYQLNEASKGNL